jgi:hypothetical protein
MTGSAKIRQDRAPLGSKTLVFQRAADFIREKSPDFSRLPPKFLISAV